MSRAEKIERPASSAEKPETGADEVQFFINVRLNLGEVTRAEAEHLLARSKRAPTRHQLIRLASRIYEARRMRDRLFDRKLVGGPAWDILLALYCFPPRGEMLSVTSLSYAANVPVTTGLQWQQRLTDEGFIERGPHGIDARRQHVRLSETGKELLERYLTRLFYCDLPSPPYAEQAGE